MYNKIRRFFRQLFCRHEWRKIAVFQQEDPVRNERYGLRRYECQKCGKISHQDGRQDRIGGIDGCPKNAGKEM